MKQTKWQRLATIGLCSSLVINAFSGVTAVAETITIESSPTVASSAKEATSASSATPASTESSQETTETSREEVTQETEKPEELREDELRNKSQIKDNNSLRSSGTRALAQMPYRAFTIYFVSEDGSFIDPSLINMSANIMTFNQTALGTDPSVYSPSIRQPISIIDAVDHKKFDVAAASYTYSTNSVFPRNFRGVSDIKITVPKKYSDLTVKPTNYYSSSKSYPLPVYTTTSLLSGTVQSSDSSGSLYELTKAAEPNTFRENYDNRTSYGVDKSPVSFGYYLGDASGVTNLIFGTTTPIYYYLTNRRVTESFKDTAGATIPAPTGFTQGKQTSITSNNYTFKQAGTLPETYKASNGKTYKFKGWYKGKTKPNTLTTTKAPSYAVTYDDNDDLNVVYEEIEAFDFPALTYQFGFVDESGKRVDASTIDLTYDNWYGEVFADNAEDTNISANWKTVSLENGQVAPTKNNLKEIVYPAQSLEILRGRMSQYSAANLTFKIPKYYENISIYNKAGTFDPAYPFPSVKNNNYPTSASDEPQWFQLKKSSNQSFIFNQTTGAAPADIQVPSYLRKMVYNPDLTTNRGVYFSIDKPIYYYLTNRKVTENFVNINGTKITPPTGFTQGKQTVINSDPYTFKQSGTLPDTYTTGGKTYKFKGWYKGKTKPNTLTTTKAPSYAVTYDDNDDLNVVYEEATEFPEETYQFGFVNEAGQLVNPDDINLTYDYKSIVYRGTGAAGSTVSFGTIANNQSGVKVGNLRQVTLPAKNIAQPTVVGWNGEAFANFSINLPKYYKSLNLYDKTGKIDPKYPLPVKTTVSSVSNDTVQPEANVIAELTLTQRADGSFTPREIYSGIDSSVRYPPFLRRTVSYSSSGSITALYQTISGPVYYHLTNRKVTENFVNTSGAKITPPTGFTQGNQIPMTSNTFKYTATRALPASYSVGGKTYIFQGWYKGKTKPSTLTTSTTPTYNTTFDGNDDMTAVYKEASISANLTMRGAVDVIDNGATMEYWEVLLKNTGEAPLTSVKIKPTTDWAAGISTPTELFILGTGQNTKVRPITKEQWEAGFEIPLDSSLPVGGQLTINLLGTKVTGQPNQVLKAAVEVTGNFNKLTASDTVRIKDLDQETKEPTGEGFISVPTFNFGQVGVAGSTQQHSLKKAADYYGNGTRNPYLRIKKTQPNWSLTAQLSQPKSATDSLPTTTRLLLGTAAAASFTDYNQPTETKTPLGKTGTVNLTADNTATAVVANQQFTGSDVYQLDFTFANIKLEVPANQGMVGQQYQAAVTWNLVTGP
ncbi:WxL domain-containing protein [Enterococcus faecalis]|uniref:WxL domain-containing protein n=1 Tax=Enterococcus faecalis TaxID=1351 RepID=UPI001158074B|nr:WxL domain-containing protein [Enterococcus faecalis]EGO8231677.1 WxL domain-containing protein [Enterococcus faecalis]EHE8495819.1 WxL domain-containing protein [Enterococcus faecalis]EIW2215728.1 WxL domain-containing protein [Enterococcus faecalis]EIX8381153.1 WxL domain-containing protein [Enterococcus faecalis]EJR1626158.1 WxL domain-containing protein [Enterococcus faecalis]